MSGDASNVSPVTMHRNLHGEHPDPLDDEEAAALGVVQASKGDDKRQGKSRRSDKKKEKSVAGSYAVRSSRQ